MDSIEDFVLLRIETPLGILKVYPFNWLLWVNIKTIEGIQKNCFELRVLCFIFISRFYLNKKGREQRIYAKEIFAGKK